MWRTSSGDRVLSEAEWNLFRVGRAELWDSIEGDRCDEDDIEEWRIVLECIADQVLWDRDYEMGGEFLDEPPEESEEMHSQAGVHPEYFTAIPRDPDEAGMIAVRQTLAGLLGRPVPDDDG